MQICLERGFGDQIPTTFLTCRVLVSKSSPKTNLHNKNAPFGSIFIMQILVYPVT